MKNTYQHLLNILEKGEHAILGTLINKKGSAPQVPGASAIFNSKGIAKGTLGGGILEAEAEQLAIENIHSKTNLIRTIQYDARVEDKKGAICGGHATYILDFEPELNRRAFNSMNHALLNGKSGFLITLINKDSSIIRHWLTNNEPYTKDLLPFRNYIQDCHSGQPVKSYSLDNGHLLIEWITPPDQLIIIGAGHIGQALCHLGSLLHFEVTVIDNRPEYAKKVLLPDASYLLTGSISDSIHKLQINSRSFVVIATQGHKSDLEALTACIQYHTAYLGMIGSKRKVKLIKEDILKKGLATTKQLKAIHAPVGLDIGAHTVQEIAISIAAELIQVRNANLSSKHLTCIILAAGMSTRMKKAKMLLPFEGSTIIEKVIQTSLESRVDKTVVVTGADDKNITSAIHHLPVHLAHNPNYKEGMLSSVQCGIDNMNATEAFIVLPGDQPLVKASFINLIIDAYRKNEKGLIVPTFKGKKGHPVLIHSKYTEQIKNLDPNIGLRQLFHKNKDDILLVEIDSEGIIMDIDTPEDYEKALKRED